MTSALPHRIDVHHHLLPPKYVAETMALRVGERSPAWSPQASIEDMDRNGVRMAVTSLMQPHVWFGDVGLARRLARESNDYAATMVGDHPRRFGMFATLPMPDIDGSLAEIAYAFDQLQAHGIGMMTSYGGRWLGERAFWPVLEELNRRKAIVYTHPLTPACCKDLIPDISNGMVEYATDTTRAIASLCFSGTAARFADIRWIFSHAGGTMPALRLRFTRQVAFMKEPRERLPHGILHELEKFYYDTAQATDSALLSALLKITPLSHLMFGTDFPYRPACETVAGLSECGFCAADLRAIDCDNAVNLMPRLRA